MADLAILRPSSTPRFRTLVVKAPGLRHLPVIYGRDGDDVTLPLLPVRPPVSRRLRRRRRFKLARVRARASLRRTLPPPPTTRGRQRIDICTAADTLTALGVRVEVVPPSTAWPRAGRFVLSDSTTWLGDLALLTAALDRTPRAAGPTVVCPVSVRYRMPSGYLRSDEVPSRPADAAATDGLVIEVRCLPAIGPAETS